MRMWCWRGFCVCVRCAWQEKNVYVINNLIDCRDSEARVFDFRRLHVFIEKPQQSVHPLWAF